MTEFYLNLPVADLAAAQLFYNGLGWPTDPAWADESATNAVVSEHLVVMLLARPFFEGFIDRPAADTRATVGALYCLPRDSRAAVDALVDLAVSRGGREPRGAQDHGFMYSRAFVDPDGHVWEVMWMAPGDPSAAA